MAKFLSFIFQTIPVWIPSKIKRVFIKITIIVPHIVLMLLVLKVALVQFEHSFLNLLLCFLWGLFPTIFPFFPSYLFGYAFSTTFAAFPLLPDLLLLGLFFYIHHRSSWLFPRFKCHQ
jgi:hypothetical protein